jgi:hypothetical protein
MRQDFCLQRSRIWRLNEFYWVRLCKQLQHLINTIGRARRVRIIVSVFRLAMIVSPILVSGELTEVRRSETGFYGDYQVFCYWLLLAQCRPTHFFELRQETSWAAGIIKREKFSG